MNIIKHLKLPFKLAVVILAIFQVYTIIKSWNDDLSTILISIFILIGCIILITLDVFSKMIVIKQWGCRSNPFYLQRQVMFLLFRLFVVLQIYIIYTDLWYICGFGVILATWIIKDKEYIRKWLEKDIPNLKNK